MDSKTFHENALKTESIPKSFNVDFDATVTALNIAVTAGNVVDAIKKAIFYGKKIDAEAYSNELLALSMLVEHMTDLHENGLVINEVGEGVDVTDDDSDIQDMRVLHGALGMFTEAAEMVDAVYKYAQGYESFDIANFCEEMGDSDWYKAILHDALRVPEEQTRATVIAKLQKRYPGKFTTEAAINRDLAGEREILEAGVA